MPEETAVAEPKGLDMGAMLEASIKQSSDAALTDPPPKEPAPADDPPAKAEPLEEPAEPAAEPAKAEPEPAKADEPPPADEPVNPNIKIADEPPTPDAKPKEIKAWSEAKARLKEQDEELARLREASQNAGADKELAEAHAAEIKAMRDQLAERAVELEELRKVSKLVDIEQSPEYRKTIVEPEGKVVEGLKAFAEKHKLPERRILEAVAETDADRRAELMDELTDGMAATPSFNLLQQAAEYQRLQALKADARTDAAASWEEIQTRRAKEQEAESGKRREQQLYHGKQAWEDLTKENPFLRKHENAEAWNEHLDKVRDRITATDVENLTSKERASLVAQASAFPMLQSAATSYRNAFEDLKKSSTEEIDNLKEQLAALKGGEPQLGGGASGEPDKDKQPQTMGDALMGAR